MKKQTSTYIKEYVATTDNNNHWYVVLTDDLEMFNNVIDSGEDPMEYDEIECEYINGFVSLVKFSNYRIE
jgi:hypothetical protein